ncbi:MAG: hypothetical protein UH071_07100, partial [Paludibacteraceae bacterium]|nr:hypothetical protein [Paludibacteraceae bacterium]
MKYYLVAVLFMFSLVAVSQEKSTRSQSMGSVSVYDDYHTNCSFSASLEQTEVFTEEMARELLECAQLSATLDRRMDD